DIDITSIIEENSFLIQMNSNASGDPLYDGYSAILSKRLLKEDELDARYFGNGWVNEEHSLYFPNDAWTYLQNNKKGTFEEKTVYLFFLEQSRFEFRYEDDTVFASGEYITHFDNMDLVFDDDCGEDIFGESINMLWADAAGYPLPPLE
ncbi:MAG: hypothetical protein K6G74_03465, partial [Bacilli bacterium]|nr:hypothetical protein [Bacilli bacterium]